MNSIARIPLHATPEQAARLVELQRGFAAVCNALAPLVRETRTWNRVALHHMAYKDLRQRFPEMGSQMVCNAIYSVSRTARVVFQSPASPFRLQRIGTGRLPLLSFAETAPVYFDRHTLSLRDGELSMFTLDGRMRFQLALAPEVEQRFRHDKLREIVLVRGVPAPVPGLPALVPAPATASLPTLPTIPGEAASAVPVQAFHLQFRFGADEEGAAEAEAAARGAELPEYVVVTEGDAAPPLPAAAGAPVMPAAPVHSAPAAR
jgi:hypothetical protein